ncbi:FecR family protein [Sunxiuqinia elliptica]|uniref:FecR family protein n=1 Tax=Sunxiuqinia elliptica TaxID=655355 RepID=A0A1I2AXP4_9BACT|nr:FecR domain-containing protein [Sunxiuqinia elliptica]SFE48586.1 FecR family protein [Sunxiuqinia elliptica]
MGANKNIKQEEWELLANELFNKQAGTSEKPTNTDSVTSEEWEELQRLSKQIDLHYQLKQYSPTKAWSEVKNQIRSNNKLKRTIHLRRVLQLAAAVVIALLIGSAAYYVGQSNLSNKHMAEVTVDDAGLSQIELSDGTLVTLNRDTKINYPDQFNGSSREVSIEGEAFFEVKPNPDKPFIIHAGDATIRVLGTSFTVNAYPGSNRVEVIVATGKVQFSKAKSSSGINQVILDPGEKGTYEHTGQNLGKTLNTDPNFLAWKTRTLVFSETSLQEVIQHLNKVYRVQIKLADSNLSQLLLNAHFEREPLDFILEVISSTHGLTVQKQGEYYLLLKKEA